MSFSIDPDVRQTGATMTYTAQLEDENKVNIPLSSLVSLTLTVYAVNVLNEPIVNLIDHLNILNAGRGIVSSTGFLTCVLSVADMVLVGPGPDEWHMMLFEFTFGNPLKTGIHERKFLIKQVDRQ